ncbi:MAG TPA: FAD-binding domain [Candidatus Acidoferrum sp.]|nr:FAD-binding domain [Candidatus Acidoferrum sp.]
MRVLICGAGIAGPTLAYWLLRHGFTPTIVESARKLRTGGYIIDFWGAGFEIAERMGLSEELKRIGYRIEEARVVDREGKRVVGFPVSVFDRMMQGKYVSLPRGELAAAIFGTIEGKVETIFGESVERIEQDEKKVRVTLRSGNTREFDLVIGADGLHSRIRELVFGPESLFEKDLGYRAAAFALDGYRPRDEGVYVMYTEVGQQMVRFAMREDRTMFFLTFVGDERSWADDEEGQKALVRKRFEKSGWESGKILEGMEGCKDFYFDRVSQIQMNKATGLWTRGRVALVGDAAFAVSLLAGQGSALAMVAAYILAGELKRAGENHEEGFRKYQELFGPFVKRKQKGALRFAESLTPRSKWSIFLRNRIFQLMSVQWIADLAVGRDLADRIEVPNYG